MARAGDKPCPSRQLSDLEDNPLERRFEKQKRGIADNCEGRSEATQREIEYDIHLG